MTKVKLIEDEMRKWNETHCTECRQALGPNDQIVVQRFHERCAFRRTLAVL